MKVSEIRRAKASSGLVVIFLMIAGGLIGGVLGLYYLNTNLPIGCLNPLYPLAGGYKCAVDYSQDLPFVLVGAFTVMAISLGASFGKATARRHH